MKLAPEISSTNALVNKFWLLSSQEISDHARELRDLFVGAFDHNLRQQAAGKKSGSDDPVLGDKVDEIAGAEFILVALMRQDLEGEERPRDVIGPRLRNFAGNLRGRWSARRK